MLSTIFSTGIDAGAAPGVLAAVLTSGVFIGILEFCGKNLAGYFRAGTAALAAIGATISGVTSTISSVLVRFVAFD